jgi:hypothetical protein
MPDPESFVLSILLSLLLRIISKATVYLAKCAFRRWIALKRNNDQSRLHSKEKVVPDVLNPRRKIKERLGKPVSHEN